jgi:hypothetical protein
MPFNGTNSWNFVGNFINRVFPSLELSHDERTPRRVSQEIQHNDTDQGPQLHVSLVDFYDTASRDVSVAMQFYLSLPLPP